jgi:hypothetical protein
MLAGSPARRWLVFLSATLAAVAAVLAVMLPPSPRVDGGCVLSGSSRRGLAPRLTRSRREAGNILSETHTPSSSKSPAT